MPILLDLYSLSDLRRPGALAQIGRALDADATLRMERIDRQDPIRNKVVGAEQYFAAQEGSTDSGKEEWYLFERRREPYLTGGLSFELAAPEALQSPHRLYLATDEKGEAWLSDPSRAAAFAGLFVRLAGAFNAIYGFATDDRMPRQQASQFAAARARGEYAPPRPSLASDAHSVRDIYWLNYFGPAYVELWGERLQGLGVRHERTSNGGLVIWATDTPPTFREGMGFMDYPWKQPFYDSLGRGAFVTVEGLTWDQQVPRREDHLRYARLADNAPSAPPSVAPMPVSSTPSPAPAWLAAKVADLRALGFFQLYESNATAAAGLLDDFTSEWGRQPEPDEPNLELLLTRFDETRVWWEDTEADVAPGNDAYVGALQGWARISRGAFAPDEIREEWLGEDGPLLVHVRLGDRQIALMPRDLNDYLDMSLLGQVNALLSGSPYRLRMYTPFDQTAFVVTLNANEQRQLEARGWSFAQERA
jgi:hypothetical protein